MDLESPDTRLAKLRARKKEFMRKYELRMKRRVTPPSPVPLPAMTRARAATSPDLIRRDPAAPIRPSPLMREMVSQGLESPGGEEWTSTHASEKDREKEKEEELYDVVRARSSSDDEDSEGFDGNSSTEEEEMDDDDEWEAEAERIFMT